MNTPTPRTAFAACSLLTRRQSLARPAVKQSGLTLIELLIATTIGLLILGVVLGVFIANNRSYKENDAIATMQDNARFALDVIGHDLQMAGFLGGIRPLDATFNVSRSALVDAAVPAGNQCGPNPYTGTIPWLFDVSLPVEFRNHKETADISKSFRCLTDVKADSDIVVIRRVAGVASVSQAAGVTTIPTLDANRIYLVANQNTGSLIQWPASGGSALGALTDCPDPSGTPSACPPAQRPVSYWAYSPRIYYVQANGGKPRLCRMTLPDAAPFPASAAMTNECLADGIENIQFEWGFDTDNDEPAHTIDTYDFAPASVATALAVRIHVIVQSNEKDLALSSDGKKFKLADYEETTPKKGVIRRSYTTTVQLKNNRLR